MLIVFGSNNFLHFLQPIGEFRSSLGAAAYILPVVGVLEVFIGILLLLKRWVPFAAILLAPISINILLFHLFLEIPGVGIAILVVVFNAILIYKHWRLYRPLFV
jgi:uncharacterized membrane protein YphA (DoxX/SURF4 family)